MIGEFWRGSLCDSYFRAFKGIGCEIIFFDVAKEYKSIFRLIDNFLINGLLKTYFSKLVNKKLIKLACDFKPDLCIIMKGQCIFPETISTIKAETKTMLFNINADDPFNRNRGASSLYVRKSLSIFDCYFIWKRLLIEPLIKRGAKRVEHLPFGFDPTMHYPVEASGHEKQIDGNDIVFVGNWDKERENWLREIKDFDLGIWGEDYWGSCCRDRNLRKLWRKKAMYGEEMSKVLNSSKISLNILRLQNKGSINMRTFELPACKVFVLAERSLEAKEFFEEDIEAVYFSTPEELRDKVKYYLKHEEERNKIGQAGYQRCVTSGYSYLERAKKILEVYKEMKINI